MVHWLRLHASNAGGVGLIPGWETEIAYAAQRGQKKKGKKDNCLVSQATFQGLDSHMQPEVSRRDSSDRDLYPLPESSIRQHWNPSS